MWMYVGVVRDVAALLAGWALSHLMHVTVRRKVLGVPKHGKNRQ